MTLSLLNYTVHGWDYCIFISGECTKCIFYDIYYIIVVNILNGLFLIYIYDILINYYI